METVHGKLVTEQDIDSWAAEAEQGYHVERLRRRGRKPVGDGPGQVVPVRLDKTLLAAVAERAERDHLRPHGPTPGRLEGGGSWVGSAVLVLAWCA